jgi:hypothetical protein
MPNSNCAIAIRNTDAQLAANVPEPALTLPPRQLTLQAGPRTRGFALASRASIEAFKAELPRRLTIYLHLFPAAAESLNIALDGQFS